MCSWCSLIPASTLARKKVAADAFVPETGKIQKAGKPAQHPAEGRPCCLGRAAGGRTVHPRRVPRRAGRGHGQLQLQLLGQHLPCFLQEQGSRGPAHRAGGRGGLCLSPALSAGAGRPQPLRRGPRHRHPVPQHRSRAGRLYLGFQLHRAGPVGPHLGRCPHQPDHCLFRGSHRSRGGHHCRCAVGLCARAGFSVHGAVQHL